MDEAGLGTLTRRGDRWTLTFRTGVEAAHLVDGEPVRLCLGHQGGHGLPGVVERPRLRLAVVAHRAGRHQDQRAGRPGPSLVAGSQRGEQPGVGLLATLGDQEPPGLAVLRRRRPAGRLEQRGQGLVAEFVRPVEPARTPPLGEQRMNRDRGAGGLAHRGAVLPGRDRNVRGGQ